MKIHNFIFTKLTRLLLEDLTRHRSFVNFTIIFSQNLPINETYKKLKSMRTPIPDQSCQLRSLMPLFSNHHLYSMGHDIDCG